MATRASVYRDQALASTEPGSNRCDIEGCSDAVGQIHRALETMERNPNERLLLESLLWSLPDTNGVTA
mgnify:CR=1 FL=1